MADVAQKSPAQLRAERYERLRSMWVDIADQTTLGDLYNRIENVRNTIDELPEQICELRERGYVYGKEWETQAQALKTAWPAQARKARRYLQDQANRMAPLLKDIEELLDRARLSDSRMDRLEDRLTRVENWLRDADSQVRTLLTSLETDLQALRRQLEQAQYLLDALSDATFPLYPEEHGVAACEAIWTDGKDEPKGVLFLTNLRLIFEQREKIATKKVLFITTKSELVQEKRWEAPVGSVTAVEAEDKGKLLFTKELLHLQFAPDVREAPQEVTLRLKGEDNEAWREQVTQTKSGQIAAQRYTADKKVAAPPAAPLPKEIPTVCPACGAQLPTFYRGMQELVCEYCGAKVRL
ncbi:MAG: hypothetical protein ACP5HM_10950 [Anaerolineae bacterium]